jgi:hypothetical protein
MNESANKERKDHQRINDGTISWRVGFVPFASWRSGVFQFSPERIPDSSWMADRRCFQF